MGFFSRSPNNEDARQDDGLRALAQGLGLEFRRAGRSHVELTGTMDGHRVVAVVSGGRSRVKVKFTSGLHDLSIRSRARNLKTNRIDATTGDAEFDALFRLLLNKRDHPRSALDYLTPYRRAVIQQLGQAFEIKEIEEDELQVRLAHEPSAAKFGQAIAHCVHVAKALDASAPPQATLGTECATPG